MSQTQEIKDILTALIELNNVSKILDTFIPAFENSVPRDNHHYLHGNFNLGGTKSGRMSSSKVNLQNLPSTGSKYAEAIKQCFSAPGPKANVDKKLWDDIMAPINDHSKELK